jgi:hydroxyacylglutathione hydrolase
MKEQYVCTVCGYNMVDRCPEQCPFCGAARENFLTSAEISRHYRVVETKITDSITMLRSEPALGFEHAAFRIATENHVYWIDCPSTFDQSLGRVDRIMYTHHHFLGAGNLYQEHMGAALAIHRRDSGHDLCRGYDFDLGFDKDFAELRYRSDAHQRPYLGIHRLSP